MRGYRAPWWLPGPGSDAPLLVLFHGLEGSSRSHYAQACAHLARERGGPTRYRISAVARASRIWRRGPVTRAATGSGHRHAEAVLDWLAQAA
jgi:predicted alpha/beta-fold hydrolase